MSNKAAIHLHGATAAAGDSGRTDLDAEIHALGPWFHNLHLPDGTQTAPRHPLGDFPARKWRQVAPFVPADLAGRTALDIGCNAGFYCLELARRGAAVTGIDVDPHYLRQARWAAVKFGLAGRIEFRRMSVYELGRGAGRWDFVLFMGVLYHLRHPLLALDLLRESVAGQLLLQTLSMPGRQVVEPPASIGLDEREAMRKPGWPKMAFIERRLEDDPTNWWAPNHACIEAMLRSAGFSITARPGHEMYLCEPAAVEDDFNAGLRAAELATILGRRNATGLPEGTP
jgi:tRNA (mo5U34)-methyltransferase